MTRRGRYVVAAIVVAVVAGFALLFPFGTWVRQSSQLASTSRQLAALRNSDKALAAQAKSLTTNAEIAYLAHKDYGLVAPGQQAYVILPTTTTTAPARKG